VGAPLDKSSKRLYNSILLVTKQISMTRFANKPTAAEIKELFPVVVEVPKGFATHAKNICRKQLGSEYYRWAPYLNRRWHSGQYHTIKAPPWRVNDKSAWQYENGRLYFKEEHNTSLISMALLTKPRRGK
jgi:hypothetical protein